LNITSSKPLLMGLATAIIGILLFPNFSVVAEAQTVTTFTTQDQFKIPELNGSIRFALNGSYSSATLENRTWTFNDLSLNNSRTLGNLKISVENSSLTVWSFRSFLTFSRSAQLRYNSEGAGIQTVNLCLNDTQPTNPIEWSVTVPGNPSTIFLAEHDHWNLLLDNTVVVSGLTGNVSVTHYAFNIPDDRNLPFYQRHSVIIFTTIILAVVAAVAVVIRFRMRR